MSGRLSISFEPEEEGRETPVHEAMNASKSLELSLDVPVAAKALVIETLSEKLFRPLPSRS
jgi:hypothetical protein